MKMGVGPSLPLHYHHLSLLYLIFEHLPVLCAVYCALLSHALLYILQMLMHH